jgi:hypothetical protein
VTGLVIRFLFAAAAREERFAAVDAAILDGRAYTDSPYERLAAKMDAGFLRVEQKMDAHFAQFSAWLARLEAKFDQLLEQVSRNQRQSGGLQ